MSSSKKKVLLNFLHGSIIVLTIIVSFVGLLFLKLNITHNSTYVYGRSMQPTLNSSVKSNNERGDFVLISKYKEAKVGDIVIATPSWSNNTVIKRLIGIPGDVVRIEKTTQYDVYCNDTLLYSRPINTSNTAKYDQFKNVLNTRNVDSLVLGEDEYFLMGDNWADSSDSISHNLKTVTKSQIRGKVDLVVDKNSSRVFSLISYSLKNLFSY